MFNLDEVKIVCALGNKEFFWQGKDRIREFNSDVGIRGIYLSLTLGIADFK